MLEDDGKHARPHSRSHPVVRSTALTLHTPVLTIWSEDDRRYVGHIEATHVDIASVFPYDVTFCDGDHDNDLPHAEMRVLSEEVTCIDQMLFSERHLFSYGLSHDRRNFTSLHVGMGTGVRGALVRALVFRCLHVRHPSRDRSSQLSKVNNSKYTLRTCIRFPPPPPPHPHTLM
jgi:hypothetical protein